jgi:MFS family permease
MAGMLISTLGASMIWPFLTIYVSERLDLPLAIVAALISLNAAMGLVFSFIAGPVTDRLGRKWVMVFSLLMNGLAYLLMSQASSLSAFTLLMAISGAVNPLYRVGVDAMMADLVPPAKRMDGFSLLRTSNNLGIALGPAIGGLVTTISYTLAFYGAAAGLIGYGLLIALFAAETLPKRASKAALPREKFGGYGRILRDRPFISFVIIFSLTQMCATLIWVLLGVYAKQNYQVPESRYGFIPATNAIMVVLFQLPVTQVTKRYPPLLMLSLGSIFYAIGVGSVALGQAFWGFWLSMVILTIGELILTPTANTYTANLAPPDMRGRYMSLYGLTWGVAALIAPVTGGYISDHLGPVFIWIAGFAIGMVGAMAFLLLAKRYPRVAVQET